MSPRAVAMTTAASKKAQLAEKSAATRRTAFVGPPESERIVNAVLRTATGRLSGDGDECPERVHRPNHLSVGYG